MCAALASSGCEGEPSPRRPEANEAAPEAPAEDVAAAPACPAATELTVEHEGRGIRQAPLATRTLRLVPGEGGREVLWVADFALDPVEPARVIPEGRTALRIELFHEDGGALSPGVFRQAQGAGDYAGTNVLRSDVNLLMANEAGTVDLTVLDARRACGRVALFDGALRVEGVFVAPRGPLGPARQ